MIEMPPDAVEVYLIRKNLSFGTFNLTVGPSSEPYAADDESLAKTTGAFSTLWTVQKGGTCWSTSDRRVVLPAVSVNMARP